jgi:hypothetical protein
MAFFIAGIPGIVCALRIMRFEHEPKAAPAPEKTDRSGRSRRRAIPPILQTQYRVALFNRLPDATPDVSAPILYRDSPFHQATGRVE